MTTAWQKINSGTMVFNPTLDRCYQVSKVITNFEGGQVITYQTMKVIDNGLLFMYASDSFAEAKQWVQADMDTHV